MKKDVKILISAAPGPNFHLYREAIECSGAAVCDGYLPNETIKDIADGFRITAVSSDDNVAEAIEHTSLPFFGVQFHPERMTPKIPEAADGKPIFDYFISLCKQNNI